MGDSVIIWCCGQLDVTLVLSLLRHSGLTTQTNHLLYLSTAATIIRDLDNNNNSSSVVPPLLLLLLFNYWQQHNKINHVAVSELFVVDIGMFVTMSDAGQELF